MSEMHGDVLETGEVIFSGLVVKKLVLSLWNWEMWEWDFFSFFVVTHRDNERDCSWRERK